MTYVQKQLEPHEYFEYYHPRYDEDDGSWDVWCRNAFGTPYVVAAFPTEELARAHAIALNVIEREKWPEKAAACRAAAELHAAAAPTRFSRFCKLFC